MAKGANAANDANTSESTIGEVFDELLGEFFCIDFSNILTLTYCVKTDWLNGDIYTIFG